MVLRRTALVIVNMAMTLAVATPAIGVSTSDTSSTCRNGFFLIQGARLLRFDDRAARNLTVARLPVHVDALAYVQRDNRFYGISGLRVISVTTGGKLTVVGDLPHKLVGADAATSDGPLWIMKSGDEIVTLRVPDLTVVSRLRLSRRMDVGDWDLNPGDGMLYGISSGSSPRLVRADPKTGFVSIAAAPDGLPSGSSFGAVAIDPFGTLHALHDATDRIFHLPLGSPGRPESSKLDLPGGQSDAATCPVAWDFGNLPGSSARHTITTFGQLSIGAVVGTDDGLREAAVIAADATSYELPIAVRNTTGRPALLAGWLDLDGDGRFATAERALATPAPGAASVTLRWPQIAVAARLSTTRLRLRLFGETPADASPEGAAAGGEIEDHLLPVRRPPDRAPPPQPAPQQPGLPSPARPSPAAPSASAASSAAPAASAPPRQPAKQPRATGPVRSRLPLTLSVFAVLLIPAITLAARAAARRGRPR